MRIAQLLFASAVALTLVSAPARAQDREPSSPDSWSNWLGLYGGGGIGGALLASSDDNGITGFTSQGRRTSLGFMGSGQLGYNFFANSAMLLGVEADISGHRLKTSGAPQPNFYGSPTNGAPGTLINHTESDWSASLRARLGARYGVFLPYVTAGVAVSEITLKNTYGAFPNVVQSKSDVVTGFTFGGGVEVIVAKGISLRVEGLHTIYEEIKFSNIPDPGAGGFGLFPATGVNYTRTARPTEDIVRTAVSFKF